MEALNADISADHDKHYCEAEDDFTAQSTVTATTSSAASEGFKQIFLAELGKDSATSLAGQRDSRAHCPSWPSD